MSSRTQGFPEVRSFKGERLRIQGSSCPAAPPVGSKATQPGLPHRRTGNDQGRTRRKHGSSAQNASQSNCSLEIVTREGGHPVFLRLLPGTWMSQHRFRRNRRQVRGGTETEEWVICLAWLEYSERNGGGVGCLDLSLAWSVFEARRVGSWVGLRLVGDQLFATTKQLVRSVQSGSLTWEPSDLTRLWRSSPAGECC